jgi:hypothetical protein
MPIVLPCPHCSHPLSVPEEMAGREFPCPLCGKTLSVAAIAPPAVPTAAPQFDFSEVEEKPLSDSPPKPYRNTVDLERVSQLLPEWKRAWNGLKITCLAVKLLIPVYVLRVLAYTVLPTRYGEEYEGVLAIGILLFSVSQFLVILVHLSGQFMCTRLPENYGTWTARRSLYLSIAAIVAVMSFLVVQTIELFTSESLPDFVMVAATILLFLSPILIVYSCWYWIGFLRKLGSGLGRYELVAVARGFMMWLWVVFFLHVFAAIVMLKSSGKTGVLLGACFGLCLGILTTIALFSYHRVLRTALVIVARRAPVQPSDLYWDEEES